MFNLTAALSTSTSTPWHAPSPLLQAWGNAARRGAKVGAVTGLLAAALDCIYSFGTQPGSPLLLTAYACVLLACTGALLGAVLGSWLVLVQRFLRAGLGRANSWLESVCLSLPLFAFAAWVPWSWIAENWDNLRGTARLYVVLVYLVLGLGSVLATRVAQRITGAYSGSALPRFHTGLIAVCAALALACYAADARILVGLYDDFHHGLSAGCLLLLATCVLLLRANFRLQTQRWRRSTDLALGAMAALYLLVIGVKLPGQANVAASTRALVTQRAISLLWAATDFDNDGFSAFFGKADCAGFDPERSPRALDFPGNQSDEDCSGADARWPASLKPSHNVAATPGYNLLFITIDTLRADRVGAYGHNRPTTPNIDALAAQSLLFENAFSQSSKTTDSVPSLFTGLYPSNLPRDFETARRQKLKPYVYKLTKDATTLAELFQRKAYATQGIVRIDLLKHLNLHRGFDKFEIGAEITPKAVAYLKRVKRPFFLWLHYTDPHNPYKKHPEHDFGDEPLDRYDSEIAFVDKHVGEVLQALAQSAHANNTLVVLTSDHGEEFREHGGEFHAPKLYHELLHVPLLLKAPGVAPQRIATQVELVDVLPSLCEKLVLANNCHRFDGQSLWRTAQGQRQSGYAFDGAYSEALFSRSKNLFVLRSLATPEWRYSLRMTRDQPELYDRQADPTEQHNLVGERPDEASTLREQLLIRPYRQLGDAFDEASTGDTLPLLHALPRLREETMLHHALSLIAKRPPKGARAPLERLLERPGLSKPSQALVRELLTQVKATAKTKKPPKAKKRAKAKAHQPPKVRTNSH